MNFYGGDWQVACGGTEEPFTFNGGQFLYVWNRRTHQHAYYSFSADIYLRDYRDATSLLGVA